MIHRSASPSKHRIIFGTQLPNNPAITAPTADPRHAAMQRIPQTVVSDLADLYKKLNNFAQSCILDRKYREKPGLAARAWKE